MRLVFLDRYEREAGDFTIRGTEAEFSCPLKTYSYKMLKQSMGRVDRLNTKFVDLYYYHLLTTSEFDKRILNHLKAKKQFNERSFIELTSLNR